MADPNAANASGRGRLFPIAVAALLLFALALAGRSLDSPGLYYDEAVQARPAREFVSGEVRATALPGSRSEWLGSRRFPVMTQPYMGALKSQALIPSLWFLGADVEVLRLTTLIWALCGLAFVVAFSRSAFGVGTALTTCALLCFDPSFLLLARHDWGSFSLSFLLRGVALWCAWRGWESRRAQWFMAAAFASGLAFYNKVDVAIFWAAVGLALFAAAGRPLLTAWRERPHAGRTAVGAGIAFGMGLAPMIPALGAVFGARNAFAQPGELAEKLQTLWTMADGSYFHRLMSTGGIFGVESLGEVPGAPGSVFPFAVLLGAAWLLFRLAASSPGSRDRRAIFLLLASALAILGVIALPGAVRIHHAMNSYPLLHLLLAYALVDAANVAGGAPKFERPTRRLLAARATLAVALVIVVSQWWTFEHTLSELRKTGGKGRWSNAIHAFAAELDGSFRGSVSSLDWGFHEPLAFLAEGGTLREPHWQIPSAVRQRGAWVISGESGDRYVLHLPPYDRSGFGEPFLEAAERAESKQVVVRRHLDLEGDLAFVSVRVNAAHRISFVGTATGRGAFRIELNP